MKQSWLDYIRNMENTKQTQVPDRIWQNVKLHIPQAKKSKRIIPFYWLFLFLGGAGTVGLIISKSNSNNSITVNINQESHQVLNQKKSEVVNNEINTNHDELNLSKTYDEKSNLELKSINNSETKKVNFQKVPNRFKQIVESSKPDDSNLNELQISEQSISEVSISEQSNQEFREIENIIPLDIRIQIPILLNNTNKHILPKVEIGECYDFRKRIKPSFYCEAYLGPQYSPFTLKSSSPDDDQFLNRRESTEKSQVSALGGVRIGMNIKDFHIKAGLEVQSIYEKLNFTNGNDTQIVNVIVNGNLIRTDTVSGKRIIKFHNFHSLLSVPVSLGYQINLNNQQLLFNAGVAFNLYAWHKGALLDTINRPSYFNSSVSSQYNSKVGLAPFASIQWISPISHNLNFFVEPSIQIYLSRFTSKINPIEQRYKNINLKLGLQYSF
ncbi:MAG: hypothetical protein ABI851_15610 [Saprospiraceae bacterium]